MSHIAPPLTPTFHLGNVVRSLSTQNEWVAFLLAHAETALKLNPDMEHSEALRQAIAGCRAAVYPTTPEH